LFFFFSSRRRHTRFSRDWSSDVCSSDLTDVGLAVLPRPDGLALQVAVLGLGVVLNGLAGALYIGAQLGPGPRDGLMTGLARRTGERKSVVQGKKEESGSTRIATENRNQ